MHWTMFAPVLSMLEACRMNSTPFSPTKWDPFAAEVTTPRKQTEKEKAAAWAALKAGNGVRKSR